MVNITQDSNKKAKTVLWQPHSTNLCWNCCHGFSTTPCYLPVRREGSHLHLTGNFCSWNCCKSYFLFQRRTRSSTTLHTITLLALLTSHRPRVCRHDPSSPHPVDCPCLDIHFGVALPPPRQDLQAFGGNKTIDEYRKGFYVIENYDDLSRYIIHNDHIHMDRVNIVSTQIRRRYTYSISMVPSKQEIETQQEVITLKAPIPLIRSSNPRVNILNWTKCP